MEALKKYEAGEKWHLQSMVWWALRGEPKCCLDFSWNSAMELRDIATEKDIWKLCEAIDKVSYNLNHPPNHRLAIIACGKPEHFAAAALMVLKGEKYDVCNEVRKL